MYLNYRKREQRLNIGKFPNVDILGVHPLLPWRANAYVRDLTEKQQYLGFHWSCLFTRDLKSSMFPGLGLTVTVWSKWSRNDWEPKWWKTGWRVSDIYESHSRATTQTYFHTETVRSICIIQLITTACTISRRKIFYQAQNNQIT